MALSISKATQGRSVTGTNALKNNLLSDVNAVIKALDTSSSAFKTLKSTIQNNWSGVDADEFLKQLDPTVNGLKEKVKAYKTAIETAIDSDKNAFAKFQEINKNNL